MSNPSLSQVDLIRKCIAGAAKDLPPLPDVVVRVLDATERENVTAAEIERLLTHDPALTAKTLRVVNSAYYGLSKQVATVQQATVILGMTQIRNLVLSVAALGLIKVQSARQREVLRECWEHGVGTACASQKLARRLRLEPKVLELSFVSGLLHDLGKLFLYGNFPEMYHEVLVQFEGSNVPLIEIERQALGLTHPEIGRELAISWKFPDPLVEAIAGHEGPFDESTPTLVALVHLASGVAARLDEVESLIVRVDPLIWQRFDLNSLDLVELARDVRLQIEAAGGLLGLAA